MRGFEQNAANKQYPPQRWPEWKDSITRTDIYRQRVFGNNSGANDFIPIDDKRKLTVTHLLIYCVFFTIAVLYQWWIVPAPDLQPVVSAIDQGLDSAMFVTEPTPRTFRDISSLDDVRSWITNAFPLFIASGIGGYGVQGVNLPLNPIRFTVRRMKNKTISSDDRFVGLAPVVWDDFRGITPGKNSSSLDDKEAFGYSRRWVELQNGAPPIERYPGLHWYAWPDFQCSTAGELTQLDTLEFQDKNESEAVELCKSWCEDQQQPQPCVCWTLSGQYTCTFYAVTEGDSRNLVNSIAFQQFAEAAEAAAQDHLTCTSSWNGINGKAPCGFFVGCDSFPNCMCKPCEGEGKIEPEECRTMQPMCEFQVGRTAYFMDMETFMFTNDDTGYNKAQGFVQTIKEWPAQEDLLKAANRGVPLESTQAISNQVGDWIAGNYLSLFTSVLTIDFVVFNPSYDVFVWVRLFFECKSSGAVEVQTKNFPLQIAMQSVSDADTSFINKLFAATAGKVQETMASGVYVVLLMCYILSELYYIFFSKGFTYFFLFPNLISMTQLMCQAATLYFFLGFSSNRITQAIILKNTMREVDLNVIKLLTRDFDWVQIWSGFAMAGMAINTLRYLNDCVPRVHVLIDTIIQAWPSIFYWIFILLTLIVGFLFLGHLMFGASVEHFSSPQTALRIILFWLFGENGSLQDLIAVYDVAGPLFYFMPYMVIVGFILFKFPTAVILVSYEDADKRHKDKQSADKLRRRAEEASSSNDQMILDRIKWLKTEIRRMMPRKPEQTLKEVEASGMRNQMMTCVFVFYVICYVAMTYLMIYVGDSFRVQENIRNAVETPTFTRVLPVTGLVTERNFSQIDSREDVVLWMEHALPKVMYSSSSDNTLWGNDNPLKVRAPGTSEHPEDWHQLVIADWNIVIGQQPVRIWSRYVKLKQPDEGTWGRQFWGEDGLLPYWGQTGTPLKIDDFGYIRDGSNKQNEVLAQSEDDIKDERARTALRKRCRGPNEAPSQIVENETVDNGWFCMLSVNATETKAILHDLADGHLVNNQSLITIIDFALYNGYSQTFGYAEIIFRFHPSGAVFKNVNTQSFRMELYMQDASSFGTIRLLLECIVIGLTSAYWAKFLMDMIQCVQADMKNMQKEAENNYVDVKQAVVVVIRSAIMFVLTDVFNFLDFISLVMTTGSLTFWYVFAFSDLRMNYFFQDTPEWKVGQYPCEPGNQASWCSDEEVLQQFKDTAALNRVFIQITGISVIFLVFRSLKALMVLPRVRMMWKSIESGLVDILVLVFLMLVVISGFLFMGRQWYGIHLEKFASIMQCMRLLVSILFGSISYDEMRDAQTSAHAVFFLYSYLVIVKILFLNCFLAILDRHFRKQMRHEEERRKHLKAAGKADKPWMVAFLDFFRQTFGRSREASDGDVDPTEDPHEQPNTPSVMAPGPSTPANLETPKQKKKHGDTDHKKGPGKPHSSSDSEKEKRDLKSADNAEQPRTGGFMGFLRQSFSKSNEASDGDGDAIEDSHKQRHTPPAVAPITIAPTSPETPKQKKDSEKEAKRKEREALKQKTLTLLSSNREMEKALEDTNWKLLPPDMQTWARETCKTIARELQDFMMNSEEKAQKDEQNSELEGRLQAVASLINDKVRQQELTASELFNSLMHRELRALKHVHLDQESLAWYIATKEKDLASLKEARDKREMDSRDIEQAAKALVRSDDSDEEERPGGFGAGGPSSSNGYPAIGNGAASSASNALAAAEGRPALTR